MDTETNTDLARKNFLAVSARYLGVHAVPCVDSADTETMRVFRGPSRPGAGAAFRDEARHCHA